MEQCCINRKSIFTRLRFRKQMYPSSRGRTTVDITKVWNLLSTKSLISALVVSMPLSKFLRTFPSTSNVSESCANRCVASCHGSVTFVATKSTFIQIHKARVGRRYYIAVENFNCKQNDFLTFILRGLATLPRSMHSICTKKMPMQ